jgi:hypothetical protein
MRYATAILSILALATFAVRADDLGNIDTGAGRGVGGARGAGEARGGSDRSAFDREPSLQEQVEREAERSTGRIVDQQTWELDQLERQNDRARPYDELQRELDRQERIDNARWRAALEERLDAFTRVDEPRHRVMTSDSATSPIFGTPLFRWIIETTEFAQTTRPSTQPASPQ